MRANYNETFAGVQVQNNAVYLGTGISSSGMYLRSFKKNVANADNWLVTAQTGKGMSFHAKALLVQSLEKGVDCYGG